MRRRTMEILFAVGRILTPFYTLLMVLRSWLYRRGVLKTTRLRLPVVSIGNLTMGGSGKTPMVRYVCELLQEKGWRPVVVCRGYGGRSRRRVNLVSDGGGPLLPVSEAGDEPCMLAGMLPGVAVLSGPSKVEVARYGAERQAGDVVVLDDGFQHLALSRDVNLALFNARRPLGNGRVFPGGDLREPLAALNRADAFVVTGVETGDEARLPELRALLKGLQPRAPFFVGRYEQQLMLAAPEDSGGGRGLRLFGFCGIATPEVFKRSLALEGIRLVGFRSFVDHYAYTAADLLALCDQALKAGATGLVTTEKDQVKVASLLDSRLPLWVLKRRLLMEDGFADFLLDCLEKKMEGGQAAGSE